MSDQKNYKELIERYLDNEMTPEELRSFQQKLTEDPELKLELEFYQIARSMIIRNKISQVSSIISEVQEGYVQTRKKYRILNIAAVATTLLLVGMAGYFYSKTTGSTREKKVIKAIERIQDAPAKKDENKEVNKNESIEKTNVEKQPETVIHPGNENTIPQPEENKTTDSPSGKMTKTALQDSDLVIQKPTIPLTQDTFNNTPERPVLKKAPETVKDPVKTSPCEGVLITGKADVSSTCIGTENGRISISNIRGGTAPYHFYLSSGKDNSLGIFTNLEPGEYSITIKDIHECAGVMKTVMVKEERCKIDLYLDPASGSPVVFPVYEKAGNLVIFDKKGVSMFTSTIESNQPFEWYGNSANGILAPGYYLFMIKYEDGTVQNGSITITP